MIQPSERDGPRGVIRYLPVLVRPDARPVALAEIIVGPHQDAGEARAKLESLLKSTGYPGDFAAYPGIALSSWTAQAGWQGAQPQRSW